MQIWLTLLLALLVTNGESEVDKAAAAGDKATDSAPADGLRPTLKEIFKPPTLLGQRPRLDSLSADGSYVIYHWAENDEEKAKSDLWLARTDGSTPPVKLFTADDAARTWWTRDGSTLLALRDGWLEKIDAASEDRAPTPLMKTGRISGIHFFEDGRRIAFSAGDDNQVWIVDISTGSRFAPADGLKNRAGWFQVLEQTRQIAVLADPEATQETKKDAKAKAEGGEKGESKKAKRVLWLVKLDDEVFTIETTFEEGDSISVSGDARFVARTKQTREPKRKLIMADYLTDQVTSVDVRSSLPGDDGAETTLELYSIEDEETFAPPLDEAKHFWTHRIDWCANGAKLLVHRQSNDFHVQQVLVIDAEARAGTLVFAERNDAWVAGPLLWAGWAGTTDEVLFTSEKSGFNHLYVHDLEIGVTRAVTDPTVKAEVQGVEVADIGGRVVVSINDPDPAERHLVAIDLGDGRVRRITTGHGWAGRAILSLDRSTVAWSQSFLGVPSEIYAAPITGNPVKLTSTTPEAYDEMEFPAPEVVEFKNPDDGKTVRALLYKPVPFDPTKTYPAVMFIHGAGYLQNVTRSMTSYGVNMLFHHRLTRKGYVVLDPDYRHSKGYGRDFRTDIYGFMGGKDLDDAVAGVDYLKSTGYVDGDRVGLYGGSYGGFMTLMALFTKPDVFACGAALRSVTDWRTYNAWYTNPRLGDPKKDEENYEKSSPLDHAEGLTKPLLILHGLKDSNVFAQDSIRLIEKLIELGKDFDAMLYPSQNHGFDDPESWIDEYKRIERFFDRHLQSAD